MKVAFIGLGVMGSHVAGHLALAGYDIRVFNRTYDKARKWSQIHAGEVCETLAQACAGANIAFSCVGDDPDVEQVILGSSGMLESMPKGAVIVDHTTTSSDLARLVSNRVSDKGIGFIDAPVSGGKSGAQHGQLSIMCGGEETHFQIARPVMETYAKSVLLMGPSGSGQLTKMVNQICIAGLVQGLAEALNFGLKAGLDMDAVVDVISKGAAQSWQMDNRAKTMVKGEFDFGFAVGWMRKDLHICFEQASSIDASLPVTQLVDQFYSDVQKVGGNRWDTSSLMHRLVTGL